MSIRSSHWFQRVFSQDTPPGSGQTFTFRKNEERYKKFFVLQTGETLNSHKYFIDRLKKQLRLQQVSTVDECDVILVFCPVVSRAGTDIEAAVKKLNHESDTKPAVLVVLHHTFDSECVVPDSCRAVHRTNTVTVDCLFHEDQGLLQCYKNNESLTTVLDYINPQGKGKGQESASADKGITNRNPKGHQDQNSQTVDPGTGASLTNKAVESDNAQHKRDQQLKSNYEQLQEEEQTLVEKMEMKVKKKQSEMKMEEEQVTKLKGYFKMYKEIISAKDAEIAKINEKLKNDDEVIQHKDTLLKDVYELLSEKETQLQKKETDLTENAQTMQMMSAALEKNETELEQAQTELNKTTKYLKDTQQCIEEKNTQLENMNKLLSEKETQLKNRDKELETSNNKLETLGQELQDKNRRLQEMMIVLEQQKTELAEKNQQLEEKERLERETQLMERDKQLQEEDKLLTENPQTLEHEGAQIKQGEGEDEDDARTGIGKSNVTADELKLETESRNKDQNTGDMKRHTENTNEVENNEKTEALLKDGITELQNIAKKPHGANGASHETDEQSQLD